MPAYQFGHAVNRVERLFRVSDNSGGQETHVLAQALIQQQYVQVPERRGAHSTTRFCTISGIANFLRGVLNSRNKRMSARRRRNKVPRLCIHSLHSNIFGSLRHCTIGLETPHKPVGQRDMKERRPGTARIAHENESQRRNLQYFHRLCVF